MSTEFKLSYTATELNNRLEKLNGVKNNIQTQLNEKADVIHNHDDDYETKGTAIVALNSAISYTDDAVSVKADESDLTAHINNAENPHGVTAYQTGAVPTTGGEMTGVLTAQNNTSYTVKQVRNIFLIAEGETLPTGSNGDICLVYTP